ILERAGNLADSAFRNGDSNGDTSDRECRTGIVGRSGFRLPGRHGRWHSPAGPVVRTAGRPSRCLRRVGATESNKRGCERNVRYRSVAGGVIPDRSEGPADSPERTQNVQVSRQGPLKSFALATVSGILVAIDCKGRLPPALTLWLGS